MSKVEGRIEVTRLIRGLQILRSYSHCPETCRVKAEPRTIHAMWALRKPLDPLDEIELRNLGWFRNPGDAGPLTGWSIDTTQVQRALAGEI